MRYGDMYEEIGSMVTCGRLPEEMGRYGEIWGGMGRHGLLDGHEGLPEEVRA